MLQEFTLSNGNKIAINTQYIAAVYGDKDDPKYTFINLSGGDTHRVEGHITDILRNLTGGAYPVSNRFVS